MTDGNGCTVTTATRGQPNAELAEIVAVPAAMPVTTPEVMPTVATEVAELVHVTPVIAVESVVVPKTQTSSKPVIGGGVAFTFILCDIEQPVEGSV
jgi:hypothetical protein